MNRVDQNSKTNSKPLKKKFNKRYCMYLLPFCRAKQGIKLSNIGFEQSN
jgi:hypothetical protein